MIVAYYHDQVHALEGVNAIVQRYEEDCLDVSPQQCMVVAEAAAEAIVKRNVCKPPSIRRKKGARMSRSSRSYRPDFKKSCRKVAVNNCPGEISDTIEKWCPYEMNMRTSQREWLEGQCATEVQRLTQGK